MTHAWLKRRVGWVGLATAVWLGLAAGVRANPPTPEGFKPSVLRIPKLHAPPVIDGKLDPAEWQEAAAITGFINFGFPGMSLPDFLQPVWYVGYDDRNFYLAFHYPVYPKGSLRARIKSKALTESQTPGYDILYDDHTEIEICTLGRERAVSGSFFKFMTNPWDVLTDQKVRYSVGQMGYEYETGATVKSKCADDYWDQEIQIPLKALEVAQIKDGDTWVMQLVSAQDPGSNYFTWMLASWLQFHMFPEVVFDSQAAAVQFVGVGDWMHGNPDFRFRCHNAGPAAQALNIAVKIVSSSGETLLDQQRAVALKAGASQEASVAATGLKLGDLVGSQSNWKENKVFLKITDAAGKVYYDHVMTLRKHGTDVDLYVKNLQDARRPAAPDLQFAYMPSFNKLKVSADVGILGIDLKLGTEARFLSAAFGPPGGSTVAKNAAPFRADGTAELMFGFPPLAEGPYAITMEIQDAKGKALVSKQEAFERKIFPFESFTLGLEDDVVAPYVPIKADGRVFETVGNRVELSDAGLVAQISNRLIPEAAGRDLLAAPIRLVATRGGKAQDLVAQGKGFAWGTPSPARVAGQADAAVAGLTVSLNAEAEYTGQYLVNMDVTPNGAVDLDRLELVIPVKDPVDTAFSWNPRDMAMLFSKEHPYTGTPAEGPLWDNLARVRTWPYIFYLGNGERGLYWYTDSYEGFWLDRNQPHMWVDKQKGATVLRVAFINKPVTLTHPRHLRFALLAVPCKPLPAEHRTQMWDSFHMALGGASWWGTIGCFVFPQDDQEWQDWIAGKPLSYKGKATSGAFPFFYVPRGPDGRWLLEKGKEYGSYRAADLIGYLQPEFKVFSGEWVDRSNPQVMPDASLLHYKHPDGTPLWPEPEQRAVYLKDATVQSFYDHEAYHYWLMAKNTGAAGHWWDWNSFVEGHSLDKGTMYLNDEGKPEPRMNLFQVRAFYHRLARMAQTMKLKDTNNMYSPGPVYQMPWLTRLNAWESMYLESDLDDMFDAQGIDKYRTIIGKYSGIPVEIVMNIPIDLKERRARTVFALALLHDNGIRGADASKPTMDLLAKAGISDDRSEWVPYWRSAPVAKADKAGLLISAYKNPAKGFTTLVVVNPDKAAVETDVALGEAGAGAADTETGAALTLQGKRLSKLAVKGHDFRLVTVQSR